MQIDDVFYGFFKDTRYTYKVSNALSMAPLKEKSEVIKQKQLKLLEEMPTCLSLQNHPNIIDVLA